MRPSDPPTLTQMAVQQILELARDRELAPGDLLPTEAEMMRVLGVSRSILREALSYLKGLGVISSRRGSGFRLTQADPVAVFEILLKQIPLLGAMDMNELFLLRSILEVGAVERAVREATDADIHRVREAADALDEVTRRPNCTQAMYNDKELEFHLAVTRPAGCRLLDALNNAIREFFEHEDRLVVQSAEERAEALRRSNIEHRLIALAFELRQPDTAMLGIRRHFAGAEAVIRSDRVGAREADA